MKKIKNGNWPEWLVTVGFMAGLLAVSLYHEPWFDEVQSWQIAKCENLFRLLFHIPHYEGNPPLWYLILAIPAKLGVPFEIGLKTVGALISFCSVVLLVFKSPFPRPVRLVLPFTYYFFYQYGVIVRPYGLMILAFILLAVSFKSRNEHPWRFVICLALLCECSSFCIVIAGCIAACWLFEILREKGLSLVRLVKNARIWALLALLVFAVFLAISILPASDASFTGLWERNNSVLECFFLGLTTFLSETLMLTSPWFSNDQTALAAVKVSFGFLIPCIIVQLIILAMILCFSSKKNLKYFLIPYLGFCLFGALVFLGGHHLGIGYCLLFFWLWISCEDDQKFEIGIRLGERLHFSLKDQALIKKFAVGFCSLSLVISLFWSISSSVQEIRYQYSYGRETARFLEETGLVNAKIAMFWDEGSEETDNTGYDSMDTKLNGWPVPLCAYFGRNIVYNFNDGMDNAAYVQFVRQTAQENKETIERWKASGIPDVLLGEADVQLLTDNAVSIADYAPVYEMKINYIWKGNRYKGKQYLFVRKDLLEEYSLTPIERPEGMVGNMGFLFSDEIRTRYRNGEDINDILKPYLDYLFGEESGQTG